MLRIQNEVTKLTASNPYNNMDRSELDSIISMFITLVWLMKDKKTTKTTFFAELMHNDTLKNSMKLVCGFDSELEMYREILSRNPGICKSKLIRNNLKSKNKPDNIKSCSKLKKKYITRTSKSHAGRKTNRTL